MADTTLAKLQRRLDRWELDHLRQLAAELQAKLEEAEARADRAEDSADFWQRHAMDLQQELWSGDGATHAAVGLTKSGELLVVRTSEGH